MIETERLIVRPPVEADRSRFIQLFTDESFTVFSAGVHNLKTANERFDRMCNLAETVPFAKQPVIDRSSGNIIGYTGVGTVEFEGLNRLEWGWRFAVEARGNGFATEATMALLQAADTQSDGQVLCIIDVTNLPSRRVADKAGFRWWRRFTWPEDPDTPTDLLVRSIGAGGAPLVSQ